MLLESPKHNRAMIWRAFLCENCPETFHTTKLRQKSRQRLIGGLWRQRAEFQSQHYLWPASVNPGENVQPVCALVFQWSNQDYKVFHRAVERLNTFRHRKLFQPCLHVVSTKKNVVMLLLVLWTICRNKANSICIVCCQNQGKY